MAEFSFPVPAAWDGASVQAFLRAGCGLSWRMVVRLKRVENGMCLDGRPVRTIDTVHAGQTVTIRMPQETPRIEAVPLPLSVVYEDASLLVIDKPPYIAVHPSAGRPEPTVANGVVARLAAAGTPGSFHPVNRLDRNTSGLLLAGKDPHAVYALTGRVRKEYLAVVLGRVAGSGLIDCPLRLREGSYLTRQVGAGGKQSRTRFTALASDGEITLLRLRLETGRTHQIRAHMAYIGHPLAGDTMYGADTSLPRHALHCGTMAFAHPVTGDPLVFSSPLPEDMAALLTAHGLPVPPFPAC
ncbi:MAG: RluA family pseudouridine synthase [Clostridia bacterium]|nr:RluA family pseudouridine synthase [Clostridia bacterium]